MKRFHQVTAILFAVFVISFLAFFIALPEKNYSSSEKRNLNHMPALSFATITDGSFMSGMEDFVCDQFPLRDFFMKFKMRLMTYSGEKESHGVYLMKNDALCERFDAPDKQNEKETIDAIRSFSTRFSDKNMVLMLVPNAVSVYPENLPYEALTEDQNVYIDDYYRELETLVVPADVRATLMAHKNEAPLYYRTDHHWTSYGANLGYELLKEKLDLQEDFTFTPSTAYNQFYGSLSSESGFNIKVPDSIEVYLEEDPTPYTVTYVQEAERTASAYNVDALSSDNPYEVFFGGNHPIMEIESTSQSERRLLVIKDSYANALLPFLIPHFEKITVVDPRYFYDDIDALMISNDFTDVLFLYNVNTLSKDTVLKTVLINEQ